MTPAPGLRVEVVLFDLDDTLLDHRSAVETAIVAHRRAVLPDGGPSDANEIERWCELEELHYHRYLAGELDFLGQRRARARAFVERYGEALDDDPAADAWWASYADRYVSAWTLFDDTERCLDVLRDRRLGVITNGDLGFQLGKLERLGLLDRFEHVVASGEVGTAKPDPGIFRHACALFGVPPTRAAYVGDRLDTDARGAASAGLLGVWLDRRETGQGAADVTRITSLDDLPPLLG